MSPNYGIDSIRGTMIWRWSRSWILRTSRWMWRNGVVHCYSASVRSRSSSKRVLQWKDTGIDFVLLAQNEEAQQNPSKIIWNDEFEIIWTESSCLGLAWGAQLADLVSSPPRLSRQVEMSLLDSQRADGAFHWPKKFFQHLHSPIGQDMDSATWPKME